MDDNEWYSKPISEIFRLLNTSDAGLTSEEVEKNIREHGFNTIEEKKKHKSLEILLSQFKTFVVWVLILASLISYSINHKIEFAVIITIIFFVILTGFLEEYKASKDMEALIDLTPRKSVVIRNGKHAEILTKEITIGDILRLRRGNVVGADARIIEANNLKVEESALTGESFPVSKTAAEIHGIMPLAKQENMVFAGTHITEGDALAVVISIGKSTEIGKISGMIEGIKEETTPLQKRLDKLARQLSGVAILMAIFVFIIGMLHGNEWSTMLIFSLAVIVSGLPESLPTVVAVTLAAGVKKMAKRNAIVKRLPAVETLGTCTVICTDKTGTLTQNKMVVENIFTFDTEVNVTGDGYRPEGLFLKENIQIDAKKHTALSKALEIGIFCNNAEIKQEKDEWLIDGEPTEGALIVLAKKAGMTKIEYHSKAPRKKEHPFDPVRKCMSTVHEQKGKHFAYAKGAPETIIKKSQYYLQSGKIKKITSSVSDAFMKKNHEYASQGLRVLALAFKEHKGSLDIKNVESNLILVGLVSIRDPPHTTVKDSIKKCKAAGIKVVMITGDNPLTAKAIAQELGIFSERDMLLTGEELDRLQEWELRREIEKVTVYARVTPEHKLKIVDFLQKEGHIVAMTGDGVNDAPALKKSDIGIAMGLTGTDVAKESADLVLKDDNFTTIVNAIEDGRGIYENIRKFIYFLLVGNFSEVLIMFIAVLVGTPLPLTALMVLFVNLVTSELPAIGISFEKPSPRVMKQKPRDPKESILSDYLLLKIAELLPLVVLGTIVLYMWHWIIKGAGIEKAQTVAFATIIFFELFQALNARTWDESIFTKGFFSNIYVVGGVLISIVLTLLAIYLPSMQNIFGTVSLNISDWIHILITSSSVILYVEVQKTLLLAELKEREKLGISAGA